MKAEVLYSEWVGGSSALQYAQGQLLASLLTPVLCFLLTTRPTRAEATPAFHCYTPMHLTLPGKNEYLHIFKKIIKPAGLCALQEYAGSRTPRRYVCQESCSSGVFKSNIEIIRNFRNHISYFSPFSLLCIHLCRLLGPACGSVRTAWEWP